MLRQLPEARQDQSVRHGTVLGLPGSVCKACCVVAVSKPETPNLKRSALAHYAQSLETSAFTEVSVLHNTSRVPR